MDYWELLMEQHEHDVVLHPSRIDGAEDGMRRDSTDGTMHCDDNGCAINWEAAEK